MEDSLVFILIIITLLALTDIILVLQLFSQRSRVKTLLKVTKDKDLEVLLHEIMTENDTITRKQDEIIRLYSEVKSISERSLQKTSLIRFNPFKDTGGDQSFALCVLDHTNSGFILTAIHSRETTRVYTKKIDNGSAKLSLSKEEELALSKIISKK